MNRQMSDLEQQLIDYYNNKLNEEQRRKIESWINSSEENRQTARRIFSFMLAIDVQRMHKKTNTEEALAKTKNKIKNKRRTIWLRWTQRSAAALLILLTVFMLWRHPQSNDQDTTAEIIEVQTVSGMTIRLTLPDSTYVCLNSESTLKYPSRFVKGTRSVYLSGEAYFEVAKDPHRRFIVHTPQQTAVEVYGTHFNVEAYPNAPLITATLTEGSIKFRYQEGTEVKYMPLNPGQKAIYNTATQEVSRHPTSGISELAWTEGKIIFDNTPLQEALHMLGKRFGTDFIVTNPDLCNNRFTGSFSTEQIEKILKHFEISSEIHWRYLNLNKKDASQKKKTIEIY